MILDSCVISYGIHEGKLVVYNGGNYWYDGVIRL